MAYLSACCIYRDDAEYLGEWLEFHLLAGVERFFLYNNLSVDSHREVIAPYLAEGIAVAHDWPQPFPRALRNAYNHCLAEHGACSRWIAFLDIDEFLFSPTGKPLPEMLAGYERHPAVGVNWAMFGTSGHLTKPDGLVIESYLRRSDDPQLNNRVKSIVDPARTLHCKHSHEFAYRSGTVVDENHQPIEGYHTRGSSFSKLRVNHYWTRSEEECRRKWDLWDTTEKPRPWRMYENMRDSLNEVRDDTLARYAPAVREALAGRRSKA